MKWKAITAAALALVFAGALLQPAEAQDVARMSKEELKAVLDSPEVVVLDVRSRGDYAISSIKITGAIREDPRLVQTWKANYDKAKTIVLYCA